MKSLDHKQFDDLVRLLLPKMGSMSNRQTFVTGALYDAEALQHSVDYSGNAQQFTVHLVQTCDDYGQIYAGKLAVVALLEHLYEQVGFNLQQDIERLISAITQKHISTPFEFVGAASEGAHIFISYSRADLALVQRLIRDLQTHGVNVWIDKIGLQPGTSDWENTLRDAIKQSDGVVLVASPASRQSQYVRDELAIARAANRTVYPVWVAGTEYTESIPIGMGYIQWVDMRADVYEVGLESLIDALTSESGISKPSHTSEQQKPHPYSEFTPRNPYKGLLAFEAKDRNDFFGRHTLVNELISAMHFFPGQPRFLAVIGPSGSGKSSLVMAGLLPELREGAIEGSDNWYILEPMVPGSRPLENLTIILADVVTGQTHTGIRADLDNPSTRGLHTLVKQRAKQSQCVLYIDQFEEVFTQSVDEGHRQQFIDLITTAAIEPDGNLIVIISLRADFYGRLLDYNSLGSLVKSHSIPVLPMTLADLYDVIERPSKLPDVCVNFEDGLVTDILFAVRDEIGALPMLQFTLDQLFQRREGLNLTKIAYEDMGGVKGALAKHAEQTYSTLPSDVHRQMAQTLFLRLINPGPTEHDTTRRRTTYRELTLPNPATTHVLLETAKIFIDARLLVSGQSNDEQTIEVSHEALIREWVRLKDWLHHAREDLRLQEMLATDVIEWLRSGRLPDRLYRGEVLANALAWADLNNPNRDEVAFLECSVATEDEFLRREASSRRNLRMALGTLVVLTLIGLMALAAIFARNNVELQNEAATLHAVADMFELQSRSIQSQVNWLATRRFPLEPAELTQTPAADFFATATAQAQLAKWQPVKQTINDVEMVLVPPGCFWMGSNAGKAWETPTHEICLGDAFFIDVYEVTNAQFGSVGCEVTSSEPDQPRNCVTWWEAHDHCEARGARLPTEIEWEYAARGADSLRFPWGNSFDASYVNGRDDPMYSGDLTSPVGSFPDGVSWVGAFDMSGNVWEWTSTLFESYPYVADDGRERDTGDDEDVRRSVRGGSFQGTENSLRAANRGWSVSGNGAENFGFRCVVTLKQDDVQSMNLRP